MNLGHENFDTKMCIGHLTWQLLAPGFYLNIKQLVGDYGIYVILVVIVYINPILAYGPLS